MLFTSAPWNATRIEKESQDCGALTSSAVLERSWLGKGDGKVISCEGAVSMCAQKPTILSVHCKLVFVAGVEIFIIHWQENWRFKNYKWFKERKLKNPLLLTTLRLKEGGSRGYSPMPSQTWRFFRESHSAWCGYARLCKACLVTVMMSVAGCAHRKASSETPACAGS